MITPEQTVNNPVEEPTSAADVPPNPGLKSPPDVETSASAPSTGLESNAVASTAAPALDESPILPPTPSVTEALASKSEVSTEAVTVQAPVPPTTTATAQSTNATPAPVTTRTPPTASSTAPTETRPTVAAQTTPANPTSTPSNASVPAPSSVQPAVAAPEQPTDSPPEQPTGTASAPGQPTVAAPAPPALPTSEQPTPPEHTHPTVAAPAQPKDLAPDQPTAPIPTQPIVVAPVKLEDPVLEQPTAQAPTLPTAAAPAQLHDPAPIQAQPSTYPAPTQVTALAPALPTDPAPAKPEASESSTQPTAAAPVPSAPLAVTNPTVAALPQLVTPSAVTNPIAATLTQPATKLPALSIAASAPANTTVAALTKPPAPALPKATIPAVHPLKPSVPAVQSLKPPIPGPPIPAPQLSNASVLALTVPPVTTQRPPALGATEPIPPVTSSMSPRVAASKSKKKKAPPLVTMATAPVAQPSALGDQGENTGRWTSEEHRLFLQGLDQHGKGWKKIASLIKSRTVVQIRTHAQKYFQKLSKARQNGEEGDVTMEGRGGVASVTSISSAAAAQSGKRRRPTTGTKRKAIHSVVSSAQREGKRLATAQANVGVTDPVPPLPAVAPILAYFALPYPSDVPATSSTGNCAPSIPTNQGSISGPALEDSIFRFLTPMPIAPVDPAQVNDVARQAGANPITLPTEHSCSSPMVGGGEISPTGVFDLDLYPTWPDNRDPPSWYAKGSDIDALLDVGGSLDWLEDTGDLHESYKLPMGDSASSMPKFDSSKGVAELGQAVSRNSTSVSTLPHVDSNVGSVVPPLPSLFDGAPSSQSLHQMNHVNASMSSTKLNESTSSSGMDDHLQVFDTPMEEDDFVSTILENANESSGSFNV